MSPPLRLWRSPLAAAALVLTALLPAGCGSVRARVHPLEVAIRNRLERLGSPFDRDKDDPEAAARALEAIVQACPDCEGLLALAELSYRAAQHVERHNADAARPWYRDAAVYAAFALEGATNAGPAIGLHNSAVEHLIRLAQRRRVSDGRPWPQAFVDLGIVVASAAPHLDPARLPDVVIARDVRVRRMHAYYGNDGLGVPLVAHRPNDRSAPREPYDRFFPTDFRAPATAVLAPSGVPAGGDWRQHPQALVLYDPFAEKYVAVADRAVDLASDRTTPLAVEVSWSPMKALEFMGLFRPEAARGESGLYLFQPYRPGKIPVVLVHGLHASPDTWAQTINHLQNDPFLAEHFQFWTFLYPTGDPLPTSAVLLRQALRDALDSFDPERTDPALGQMVLVGHSLGGVICKMMAQDSETLLWDALLTVPVEELRAPPAMKGRLTEALFYRPEPHVRRLVFISTLHKGTWLANRFLGRFVQVLMHPPEDINADLAEVARSEGRGALAPGVRLRRLNGVGGLRPGDPLLQAIDRAGIDPLVPYHSIIPQIGTEKVHLPTDGVVTYRSSHIDGAESERITPGRHISHEAQAVTDELKRVLREHLAALAK